MGKRIVLVLLLVLAVALPARAFEGLQAGMDAPPVSLQNLDGTTVKLSDFAWSKLVILTFFATWNERSIELLERLQKLQDRYKAEGLVVLAVNVESLRILPEEEAVVRKTVREIGVTYPILIDRGLETFRSYGVVAVPSTVIVDPAGKIAGELSGYPLALREGFFDLVEATMTGKQSPGGAPGAAYRASPKAIRYFNLGKALAARGSVDMAEADLRKSMDTDPRFVLPLVLLGQILRERALTDEQVEFQGKTYTTAFFSREECDRYLVEAASLFGKALELEPNNATVLTEEAVTLAAQGRLQEAEGLLRKGTAAGPAYTPAHYQLGALLLRKGDVQGARRERATSESLNPLDYRVYLTFAQAYEEKGMAQEALDLYKKSLDLLWPSRKELFPLSFGR